MFKNNRSHVTAQDSIIWTLHKTLEFMHVHNNNIFLETIAKS